MNWKIAWRGCSKNRGTKVKDVPRELTLREALVVTCGYLRQKILRKAGGAFGDKGFIGADYITTPIRKPKRGKLVQWQHEWNSQVSSYRAPVERAVATLKTWRILFTDYRRPLKTFRSSFRAAIGLYFFKEGLHNPLYVVSKSGTLYC